MKKIFVIAGEASGDKHAAQFIKKIKAQNNQINFYGVGGPRMREAGAEIILDNHDMAVVGIVEVLKHYRTIMNAFKVVKNNLITLKPDLLILIDYPGFNLKIAKFAKQHHIKILYYISPQLWAWHKSRIQIIKECVDTMAVILPFEVEFYQQHEVQAHYVGHPLMQTVQPSLTKQQTYQEFGLDKNRLIIGLVAGSRKSEIKHILPTILKAAKKLAKRYPNAQFVLPLALQLDENLIQSHLKPHNLPIKVIKNQMYNLLQVCDAAICVSGTVTLEVAMLGIPFVIIYRFAFITALLALFIIDVEYIGLANIIAGEMLAKELIQYKANATSISNEIIRILEDKNYNQSIRQRMRTMKTKHQASAQPKQIAELITAQLVCD
ncbi:MAG: lipid-A-disaccharide synthase [Pseudomonadota bacterium]